MDIFLRFPQDLLCFLFWILFRPVTLRRYLAQFDPPPGSVAALFVRGWWRDPARRSLALLALFYVILIPWLVGFGTGMVLTSLGVTVKWLRLFFYLVIVTGSSLTFSLGFCVVFLMPFSLAVTVAGSGNFTMPLLVLVSFALGLAYGLMLKPALWGLAGGLTYGVVFSLLADPLGGLTVGAAFLIGYFRIFLYVLEVPFAWALSLWYAKGHRGDLRRCHPAEWDELIWFPLPRLE